MQQGCQGSLTAYILVQGANTTWAEAGNSTNSTTNITYCYALFFGGLVQLLAGEGTTACQHLGHSCGVLLGHVFWLLAVAFQHPALVLAGLVQLLVRRGGCQHCAVAVCCTLVVQLRAGEGMLHVSTRVSVPDAVLWASDTELQRFLAGSQKLQPALAEPVRGLIYICDNKHERAT